MIKNDRVYLEHILNCIDKIEKFTLGMSREDFLSNTAIQDAVIRNIEVMGEATKRLSKNFRDVNTLIPWIEIAGMRDKLIHDYMDVDMEVIWITIQDDIPELKNILSRLIQ